MIFSSFTNFSKIPSNSLYKREGIRFSIFIVLTNNTLLPFNLVRQGQNITSYIISRNYANSGKRGKQRVIDEK